MVPKRDDGYYLSVISENLRKDSRFSIPEIIISASDDVSQAEVDMATSRSKLLKKTTKMCQRKSGRKLRDLLW